MGPSSSSSSSSISGAPPMNAAMSDRIATLILPHSRDVRRETMQVCRAGAEGGGGLGARNSAGGVASSTCMASGSGVGDGGGLGGVVSWRQSAEKRSGEEVGLAPAWEGREISFGRGLTDDGRTDDEPRPQRSPSCECSE